MPENRKHRTAISRGKKACQLLGWQNVINAPAYNMTVSGTGSLSGAFIANSIVISGGASVHYDESLNAGGQGGTNYSYASWFEDTR